MHDIKGKKFKLYSRFQSHGLLKTDTDGLIIFFELDFSPQTVTGVTGANPRPSVTCEFSIRSTHYSVFVWGMLCTYRIVESTLWVLLHNAKKSAGEILSSVHRRHHAECVCCTSDWYIKEICHLGHRCTQRKRAHLEDAVNLPHLTLDDPHLTMYKWVNFASNCSSDKDKSL